jgi:iron transport multicopper oxidase
LISEILAYEAAEQLIEAGEEVASVLMVNCPCPVMLPPMPPLIDYIDLIFFGTDAMSPETPEKRLKSTMHRYKNVKNLAVHMPVPLSAADNAPQTLIIWVQDRTRDPEKDPEPDFTYWKDEPGNIVRWILDPRPILVLMDGAHCFQSTQWC